MTVSIIIAVKTWQRHLEECVEACAQIDSSDFEILILPDFEQAETRQGRGERGTAPEGGCPSFSQTNGPVPVRIIPTGVVTPPKKRDIGIEHAAGEILAFIDDDAYPQKDWLKNALENFKDETVAAVGGPAITPKEDNLRQKASGAVYASFLVSGKFRYRYVPKKRIEVDDYPTCNFLVRKSVMQELGGFNTNFWPGEDTKLCLDITKRLKKKIIYDPKVLVFHHRRPVFLPHLRQIMSYALHRGYFVKRYPGTSLKFSYFIPSILVSFLLVAGAWGVFFNFFRIAYLISLGLYLFLVFIFSLKKNLRLVPLVFLGTVLTHICYGVYFIKGLLSSRLAEERGTVPEGDCPSLFSKI